MRTFIGLVIVVVVVLVILWLVGVFDTDSDRFDSERDL
jgi:uncharacterized alpha/beta hydrolase family protein